ncbi:Synaptic vesicle protein 2 [Operophtera brumata]|uniref:Synaptic vesicle protein 2 n=1 Tax=Operophtera brumata TaxID=104452 RepID=A0A0L7KPV9_OPEBR|nr:Synaptic vesicle protein 2 [Operophtera brumata]
MSEEYACLVRARSDSETSANLGGFDSITRTMTYTEDKLNILISLMGCAFGSVGWGSLSARLGRRRTLLSCLAVNAVFATIAAFMPTYGTFMMAR